MNTARSVIFLSLFLAALLLSISTASYGQSFWSVDGHTAKISMRFPQAKTPNVPFTFYVDWDPSSRCAPTVGMIVPKKPGNSSMGKFQNSNESSENMVVTVDGKSWGSRTVIASYTNALDAMSYAPSDLMDALRNSSSAQFKLFRNSPALDVPLEGAREAIDAASRNCN